MKSCPTCHQVYPDNGPDYCTNDGTPLQSAGADYNPAAGQGGQWGAPPPPPPGGYNYQPGAPYSPQGGGYPPYNYAPASGAGKGVAKAALFTGISATGLLIIAIAIAAAGGINRDTMTVVGILGLLMLLCCLGSIVLGIVALSMAGKDSGVSKPAAIIGMCLGALPLILWLIGVASGGRRF